MQRARTPHQRNLDGRDRRRLARALCGVVDVATYRRLQAVLLVARGMSPAEVAAATGLSARTVMRCVARYRAVRRPAALCTQPRRGRPPSAHAITAPRILAALRRAPWRLGYAANGWTVALLATYLSARYDCPITSATLRRRMRALGLRWKRPRYVYATKDPHRAQKKGGLFAA